MERHKCKLCTRTFANGRALGGHMKAHLATLPVPPKTQQQQQQLGLDRTESASSSSYFSSGEEQEQEQEIIKNKNVQLEEKPLVYGLRENPRKSFRLADPEFSFAAADAAAGSSSVVVVQDRESETESRNPTRRRSKRTRKSGFAGNHKVNFEAKKVKFKNPSSVEESPPAAEPEPVSSVSNTSPEEDVAMCLMMLSRDVWMRNNEQEQEEDQEEDQEHQRNINKDRERSFEMVVEEEIKVSKIRGKLRCEKCMKLFRSSQALGAHKRICSLNGTELRDNGGNERIFQCPYCFKIFGSGQALGGHKRSHLMGSSTATAAAAENSCAKLEHNNLIDLNLPAPTEDDDFSVVSVA